MATHVNTDNIHNHIIWNSTNLDCDGKWRDVKRSGKDLAFRKKGQKKFTRLRSLGEEYSEEKIIEKISLYSDEATPQHIEIETKAEKDEKTKGIKVKNDDISLLLDLQKIKMQGKGAGSNNGQGDLILINLLKLCHI